MPLIEVDSNVATFSPVPPDKYSSAVAALRTDSRVTSLAVADKAGHATAGGIDVSWVYDGADKLAITIVKKHGFIMSHVPNATIFDGLSKQLSL